jgi:hypothetical protein
VWWGGGVGEMMGGYFVVRSGDSKRLPHIA